MQPIASGAMRSKAGSLRHVFRLVLQIMLSMQQLLLGAAIEEELRSAMKSPSHLATPEMSLPHGPLACSLDYSGCPNTFRRQGSYCVATTATQLRAGCANKYNFASLSLEQKKAIARSCAWTFPCQGDCEASCHVAGKLKRFWALPAKLASSVARSIGKQIVLQAFASTC